MLPVIFCENYLLADPGPSVELTRIFYCINLSMCEKVTFNSRLVRTFSLVKQNWAKTLDLYG